MRKGFAVSFIVVLLFAGGYFYYVAQAICPIPLTYTIGDIDPSFDLSFDEAKLVITEAESAWEDATGQNLFTYRDDADFTINFVYDERQATTDAEGNFKEKLDKTQSVTDAINRRYNQLVTEYDRLQVEYSKKVARYEKNLAAYNTQVEALNAQGGADPEEYAVLQERKDDLDVEREELNTLSRQLNNLVDEINRVGEQGNRLIEAYNRGVQEYNDTFGTSREFTQGTYSSDKRIDIYAFQDMDELRVVLAHEFGHALSLEHVGNEKSLMYFLMGKQPVPPVPSTEDMEEFNRVCASKSLWDTIKLSFTKS